MKRKMFWVLLLISLFSLIGCKNQEINFDEIEIEAIDRVDIPEGIYSIVYSIENIGDLIEKHGAIVSFAVTNSKDENLIVTDNTFIVEAPVYKKEGYILTFDKYLDNIKTDLEINAVWNIYLRVNEFNEPDPLGDFILFGEYPQTIKDPTVTVNLEVTDSRGYALGSDGFYYASKKGKAFTSHSVFSNDEIIYETITYQFRVEPIKWRILLVSSTEYFLFSTIALEAKQFYESNSPREIYRLEKINNI